MTRTGPASVSIIIPTLNEAEGLPAILTSIARQTVVPLEVIVADANSTDGTRAIAREHGAIVTDGGLPSVARNKAATIAEGDYLLFLDADSNLPVHFLERAIPEFEDRGLDVAALLMRPRSRLRIDALLFGTIERIMRTMNTFYPSLHGAGMLIRRRLHERIKGFDERLRVDEDTDYGERARKQGKFGVILSTYYTFSTRRFDSEGRLNMMRKYFNQNVLRNLRPLGITYQMPYEFANFKHRDLNKTERFVENMLGEIEHLQAELTNLGKPKRARR